MQDNVIPFKSLDAADFSNEVTRTIVADGLAQEWMQEIAAIAGESR